MPDTMVIHPPDEIDPATASVLDEQLGRVDPDRAAELDFAAVTFCDSSGIRVLIQHATRLRDGGGTLRIVNIRTVVRRVFDLAGVSELLGVQPTV